MITSPTLRFIIGASALLIMSLNAQSSRVLMLPVALPPKDLLSEVHETFSAEARERKLNQLGTLSPQKIGKRFYKGLQPRNIDLPTSPSGILGIYGGYYTYSSRDGFISFPLRHDDEEINLIVTPHLDLNFLHKQTISHLAVKESALDHYKISEQMYPRHFHITPASSPSAWDVKERHFPMGEKLPADALIIIANPRNIFVPEMTVPRLASKNLIGPTVYLIGKKSNDKVLLNNLHLLTHFEEIMTGEKEISNEKRGPTKQSQIVND